MAPGPPLWSTWSKNSNVPVRYPIVVITPVRNEAWIVRRFLEVTSRFADRIVVADQHSSDESREICAEYPSVTLIENEAIDFNEAERQKLLINVARRIVPGPKILLALDADEILAANAMGTAGWQRMLAAAPGTILELDLCDLFQSAEQCIRYRMPSAIGYIDDGAEHFPKRIHSERLPTPISAPRLHLSDVTVLHYALTRLDAYESRTRFYSVVENVLGTSNVFQRRRSYAGNYAFASSANLEEAGGRIQPTPPEWLKGWEDLGVDMRTIPTSRYYWHDFEVLRYFHRYGAERFWLENIWNFDWNACRDAAPDWFSENEVLCRVRGSPIVLQSLMRLVDTLYSFYCGSRRALRTTTSSRKAPLHPY
jgi:glycosyltransferase involved in cell wall biosynthesis